MRGSGGSDLDLESQRALYPIRAMTIVFAILTPFVILLPILAWFGRRFERRRRQEGAWDEHGPKHPTNPPSNFLHPGWPTSRALDEWMNAALQRRPVRSLGRWRRR
jgi:hypothetical protein